MASVHVLQHVVVRVLHPDLHPGAAVAPEPPELRGRDVIRPRLLRCDPAHGLIFGQNPKRDFKYRIFGPHFTSPTGNFSEIEV